MNINSKTLQEFTADFHAALKDLEAKYGVIIQHKRISYSEDEFSFKVEVKVGASEEEVARNNFAKNCGKYGLKPEHFMKTFKISGDDYQIIGIEPRRAFSIIVKRLSDGKEYFCSPESIPFAEQPSLQAPSSYTHKCKYCGSVTSGKDEDLLCSNCMATFGHMRYSEL